MTAYGVARIIPSGHVYVLIWEPENVGAIFADIDDWATREDMELDWLDATALECSVRHVTEVLETE